MKKAEVRAVWWVMVRELRAWGWSFTEGAKDISKEEIRDWVNHFQWKWHANQGGFFACLLFRLCDELRSQHPPLADVATIRAWTGITIRPILQVMALELAITFSGPHHWSLHGIPEPIMEWMVPGGDFVLGIMGGGVPPDWIPTSLFRPDPTNPDTACPIEIINNLLPLQLDN